jgi:hypothetical protein
VSEKQIEAKAERLHAVGQATVKRLREAHGMTHKFPTGPDAYDQQPTQFQGVASTEYRTPARRGPDLFPELSKARRIESQRRRREAGK